MPMGCGPTHALSEIAFFRDRSRALAFADIEGAVEPP